MNVNIRSHDITSTATFLSIIHIYFDDLKSEAILINSIYKVFPTYNN